jgi:TonB-linked SusC/RagA family outer membrane protein
MQPSILMGKQRFKEKNHPKKIKILTMQKLFTKRKNWLYFGAYLLFSCFISAQAIAQTKVSGTVTDTSGETLVGVSVSVKNTKTVTGTNNQGKFQITLPVGAKTLVFKYIGFHDQEVTVTNNTDLKVILKSNVSNLDEVVVIGYGSTTRRELTGSVASVKMVDLQKAPVKSFDEALAGRVAGVQVTSSEGKPGSSIDIVIRGTNSITQNNSPLFVVDDMIFEDPNGSGTSSVNPVNTIDPNDIESIDILKDAVATAIYGARGANGVVIITTKKGKLGKPVISYDGYYGVQENNKRMELLNGYDFVKLMNEIDPVRTKSLYLKNGLLTLDSYKDVQGINWEDQIMQTAAMQNHYLSVAGGTETTKYNVSFSNLNQEGIIINSGFNRTQGRFSLDQTITKKLKFGLNANFAKTKTYGTSTSAATYSNSLNLLYSVWAYRPVTANDDLDLLTSGFDDETSGDFRFNPILTTKDELRETYGSTFNGSAYAEYSILPSLKLRVSGSYNQGVRDVENFNGPNSRTGATGNYLVSGGKIFYNSNSWLNSNTLTYIKRFNKKHLVNAMLGLSFEESKGNVYGGYSVLLPNANLGLDGADQGTPNTIYSSSSNYSQVSSFFRLIYTYNDKYSFTASQRADGSSRFTDNPWGFFPALGLTWQLGKEDFIKNIKAISSAKVRTSFGKTGNNQIGNYSTYASIDMSTTSGYTFGGVENKGVYLGNMGNAGLKWETTDQYDLGFDLGLFNERLTFGFDAYYKKTHDLLLNAELPASTGFSAAYKNIGSVRNRGLEFTLSGDVVKNKNFNWNSSINISFNRNKVLGLTENQTYRTSAVFWGSQWDNETPYIAQVGSPIALMYGYIYDGTYKYEDFDKVGSVYTLKNNITANGETRANVKPGDAKYKDLNGDLLINESDRVIIGNPTPKHTGGFVNNFSYKGFDLSVFMQWSYGNDIINANRLILESGGSYNTNQFASYANRWTPENPTSDIPQVLGSTKNAYSTRIIEDGSFLRLKTVSLGYTVKPEWIKNTFVKSLRAYATAQNLHTWSNYSGYDAEVSVKSSALTPGFDYSAYPRAKTFVFGLKATF